MKEKNKIREEKLDKVAGGFEHDRVEICPDCGKKHNIAYSYQGSIICSKCGKSFQVSRQTLSGGPF